jgi:hypothetical protein
MLVVDHMSVKKEQSDNWQDKWQGSTNPRTAVGDSWPDVKSHEMG